MAYDEMELDLLGDRRTALFVIISDTDDTFNFVVSIMYTQLFNLLCDRADDQCGGQLKYHVRLLLDEFANIGLIPKFDKLIATIRSREISASIILQSQSQLKTIYKDAAETIIGNCDTMLFLGGKESSTLKEISETLGKETIDLYNTSDTRGQSPSFGTTYQKTGKELMSRDELSVMDGSKCILQLRGVRPFLSDKFDITKHTLGTSNAAAGMVLLMLPEFFFALYEKNGMHLETILTNFISVRFKRPAVRRYEVENLYDRELETAAPIQKKGGFLGKK